MVKELKEGLGDCAETQGHLGLEGSRAEGCGATRAKKLELSKTMERAALWKLGLQREALSSGSWTHGVGKNHCRRHGLS